MTNKKAFWSLMREFKNAQSITFEHRGKIYEFTNDTLLDSETGIELGSVYSISKYGMKVETIAFGKVVKSFIAFQEVAVLTTMF